MLEIRDFDGTTGDELAQRVADEMEFEFVDDSFDHEFGTETRTGFDAVDDTAAVRFVAEAVAIPLRGQALKSIDEHPGGVRTREHRMRVSIELSAVVRREDGSVYAATYAIKAESV